MTDSFLSERKYKEKITKYEPNSTNCELSIASGVKSENQAYEHRIFTSV